MSDVADWWTTAIIDMEPGRIAIRGEAIEDLIGQLSFVEMVWLKRLWLPQLTTARKPPRLRRRAWR